MPQHLEQAQKYRLCRSQSVVSKSGSQLRSKSVCGQLAWQFTNVIYRNLTAVTRASPRGSDKHASLLLTFAQCKARAQKTANILKLFSSVLVKALPFSLFTICTTPITVPRLTMGMHRMFRVV